MNRTITIITLSAAVLALGGCDGGKADPAPTASTTTESPIPVTQTLPHDVTARRDLIDARTAAHAKVVHNAQEVPLRRQRRRPVQRSRLVPLRKLERPPNRAASH
jgi:hypothetical protein